MSDFERLQRLQKLERFVLKQNRGCLSTRGCILCGAHRRKDHTCGLAIVPESKYRIQVSASRSR